MIEMTGGAGGARRETTSVYFWDLMFCESQLRPVRGRTKLDQLVQSWKAGAREGGAGREVGGEGK